MSTVGFSTESATTAGDNTNVRQDHHVSPTSIMALSIDVNTSPHDQQSESSLKRGRRRRKGKARANQVEPVGAPSTSPRSRQQYNSNNHRSSSNSNSNNNNNRKKKNKSGNPHNNNGNGYSNNDSGQQQQTSSSFRTPIAKWRGTHGARSNINRYNNNNSNNSGGNNHNRHNNRTWNHPSPRFNKSANSPICPASTGYPTSKKQHDAPMKKRDLYFALHVDRVAIASQQSTGNKTETQSDQQAEQKAVARVTLTNWENEFVLDTFVAIHVPVSDFYDTGIRPEDVSPKNTAAAGESKESCAATDTADGSSCSFAAVSAKVERILRGKILIGYEIDEALQALGLSHPNTDTRDCSVYFSNVKTDKSAEDNENRSSMVSCLEDWSQTELNRPFQSAKAKIAKDSPHNNDVMLVSRDSMISRRPVQICVTTMDLYKKRRKEWETNLIARARERERQQQDYLIKISQQRQQEHQQAAQQQAQQQQQYRETLSPISIHCETVRTALSGRTKTLARVTIVDGPTRNVLLDEFVQIPVPVTDFCDTGITAKDVMVGNGSNSDAPSGSKFPKPLSYLRGNVERLSHGRLLVGYKIDEALKALGLSHPWMQVRDIAYFSPFLHTKLVAGSTSVVTVRSLDELSEEFLAQRLRSPEDRSRPLDLCLSVLGLYERFRDQFEREFNSQHHDVFAHRRTQQQQILPHQMHVRMTPPSTSTMMQSTQLRPDQYYGQQPQTATYSAPMMMTPPRQQQLQRQVIMSAQQQQYSDNQSRSSPSSWFNWGRTLTQTQQSSNLSGVSQTLSSQAFQALQEDSCDESPSAAPKNHFLPVASNTGGAVFGERRVSHDYSAYGAGSEFSAVSSEFFATESVVSSIRDEVSSVFSADQSSPNPAVQKRESSSIPSSWFLFGSKKSKDSAKDETKSNCETMASVQETKVLTEDDMLPPPTNLFPPEQASEDEAVQAYQKVAKAQGKVDRSLLDATATPPQMPRSWFGFRKSPVQKDRSRSPTTSSSESTLQDLSIAAHGQVPVDTATEASIEITLSIPTSNEAEDTIVPLTGKPGTTSLASRPSSSWFGFRRSKSSGSKNGDPNALVKGSTQGEACLHPGLLPAPTERTTAMDDDWLQEVMSQSTGTTQEVDPWMNGTVPTNSGEITEKPSSTSRGQASWFAFKRSKAVLSSSNNISHPVTSLDTTGENQMTEVPSDDDAWSNGAAAGGYFSHGHEEANLSIPASIEHNDHSNVNDFFHTRARFPTESTIPSIATDEEERSLSGSYSRDLDFGAAQSFNFLKI